MSAVDAVDERELARVVESALAEDVGEGDLTTEGVIGPDETCRAAIVLKEPGVVCGIPVAAAVFRALAPAVRVEQLAAEGEACTDTPVAIARVEGPARAVLTGERTALNLVGRLGGVATLTRSFVEAIAGTEAVILDTRKTTPGLRALEKYAVRCGGGQNHRLGLDDGILVKDNHIRLAGGMSDTVARLRAASPGSLPVQVEAETLEDVREALAAGVDALLLDNMTIAELEEAVDLVAGRVRLEASGGVSLATVRAVAQTGVDVVSVGALTHAARSLDVSLEVA